MTECQRKNPAGTGQKNGSCDVQLLPENSFEVNVLFALLAGLHAARTRTLVAIAEGEELLEESTTSPRVAGYIHNLQRRRKNRLAVLNEQISALGTAIESMSLGNTGLSKSDHKRLLIAEIGLQARRGLSSPERATEALERISQVQRQLVSNVVGVL